MFHTPGRDGLQIVLQFVVNHLPTFQQLAMPSITRCGFIRDGFPCAKKSAAQDEHIRGHERSRKSRWQQSSQQCHSEILKMSTADFLVIGSLPTDAEYQPLSLWRM
jgi:hypothetical protein